MRLAIFLPLLIVLVACQPGPKQLAGTYHIRITPDLEESFTKADKTVADEWKVNKERAERMAASHPRRVIQSQKLVIGSDHRYRYSGTDGQDETVIEGKVEQVGDTVTLVPLMRNGSPATEIGLQPQKFKFDLEAQTLTIDIDNAPMIWAK